MAYTTIDDPSAHFHTQLHTGTGSAQTVTNDANAGDFKPDWIWVKNRDATDSHMLSDSSRGSTNALTSQGTDAEFTPTNGNLAFLTDGYSFGSNNNYNRGSDKFVAWQWKANGGTTSSNSDGSITSTVQANTTAGFSIVTYTGTGSAATIGHGLGAEPDMVIIKSRSNAVEWQVYLKSFGNDDTGLFLDTTDAATSATNYYNNGGTSSVFGVSNNTGVGTNTYTYVAYCFRNIQGYSKIGSYTGNGNADGTFVYTGFKPAWVMTKEKGATGAWYMHDTKRDPSNGATHQLIANTNEVEYDTGSDVNIDILSNGFKQRYAGGSQNGNGDTHIYIAFAESPFVSSKGVPTTAR